MAPQLMPGGLLVTLPLPLPVLLIVSVRFGAPSNTLTPFVDSLAVARSINPSELRSPVAIENGPLATLKDNTALNVPLPLPNSTLTSLLPKLATARSG